MPRKRRDSKALEESRDRVVRYAQGLFFANSFSAITMDQIALELGMSKKTLYKYFGSKNALLEVILEKRMLDIDMEFEEIVASENEAFGVKLSRLVDYAVHRFAEMKKPFVTDLKQNAPEFLSSISAFRERIIPKYVMKIVAEGREKGRFREDFDLKIAVQMFVHSASGLLLEGRSASLDVTEQAVIDEIITIILYGIHRPGVEDSINL